MLYNINRQIQEALPSPVSDDVALDEDVRPSRSVSTVPFSNSRQLVSAIFHLFSNSRQLVNGYFSFFSNSSQLVCGICIVHVIICFFMWTVCLAI